MFCLPKFNLRKRERYLPNISPMLVTKEKKKSKVWRGTKERSLPQPKRVGFFRMV